MGRKMFSGGSGPWEDDPNALGWWGDDPPFHHPVFVLTHHEREPLEMEGGTTFTFVTDGIESALEQARRGRRRRRRRVARRRAGGPAVPAGRAAGRDAAPRRAGAAAAGASGCSTARPPMRTRSWRAPRSSARRRASPTSPTRWRARDHRLRADPDRRRASATPSSPARCRRSRRRGGPRAVTTSSSPPTPSFPTGSTSTRSGRREEALLAFRGSGPPDDVSAAIAGASVRRHEIASSGPP